MELPFHCSLVICILKKYDFSNPSLNWIIGFILLSCITLLHAPSVIPLLDIQCSNTFPSSVVYSFCSLLIKNSFDINSLVFLFFYLFYVCECFQCSCVCAPLVYLLSSKARRGHWISWRNWSYGQTRASVSAGNFNGSSARTIPHNFWTISPELTCAFVFSPLSCALSLSLPVSIPLSLSWDLV